MTKYTNLSNTFDHLLHTEFEIQTSNQNTPFDLHTSDEAVALYNGYQYFNDNYRVTFVQLKGMHAIVEINGKYNHLHDVTGVMFDELIKGIPYAPRRLTKPSLEWLINNSALGLIIHNGQSYTLPNTLRITALEDVYELLPTQAENISKIIKVGFKDGSERHLSVNRIIRPRKKN